MSNNITVKDASGASVILHTIEDATSVHFNQSIPTDIANNTATVVSGGQAVASGMGALVVAQRDALPAGTNLLGGVSVRGISDVSVSPNGLNIPVSIAGTITVGTHAVTQSGAWTVSVSDKVSVAGLVGLSAGTNLIGSVSISPNGLNLPVSVAGTITVGTHAVTQSGSWAITSVNSRVGVSVENVNNIAVSIAPPTFNIPVSIANTLDIDVSVGTHPVTQSGTWTVQPGNTANTTPWLVSVNGTAAVSLAPPGYNLPVSVHPVTQSGTWNVGLNAGANLIGAVSISPNGLNIPVSVANTINVGTHAVTQSGAWNVGLNAGTNHIGKVSVEGLSISGVGTQLVSVGGAVSTQGVQIVGRDGSGNARVPYVDASGIARVSIEGSLTVSGSSMVQTVGAAVTTQGYPMLGSDGTNARRLLTTTGGALVVHVSNSQPAVATSIAGVVSVVPDGTINWPVSLAPPSYNLPVSVHPVTQSGTWTVQPGNTPNTTPWLVSVNGTTAVSIAPPAYNLPVSVHPVTQSGTWNVGLNAGTALVGAVSISPNGLNIPVSVAGTITVGTHAVTQSGAWAVSVSDKVSVAGLVAATQSGTWNVGLNAGTALIGAVSISPNGLNIPVSVAGTITVGTHAVTQSGAWTVSVSDKVSVAGLVAATQSGTWNVGLNAGTALVGAVSISPNGLNIPVSVANTINVATHAVTQSGTWNIGAITSINSRVAVSVENVNNIAVSLAPPAYNLPVSVHPVTQSGTWSVGLTAGTALVGAVSISPNGLNIPVSVANTINVNTHAVTQSGTWNVGALTSINSIVKVSIEGSLTVSGSSMVQTVGAAVTNQGYPMLGTDGTNARGLLTTTGGALVTHVSNLHPVSISGLVSTTPAHAIGAAIGNNAMPVGGTNGTNLVALLVDALGALKTSGFVTNAESSFTRSTDTVAYAVGDLVANTTVAGTVTPLTFNLSRYATGGGTVMIRRARIVCSDPRTANDRNYRLHLFNTSAGITNAGVSVAGGDNTAFQPTKCSAYLGYISVAVAMSCGDGAVGWGSPSEGMEMNVVLPTNQFGIQGLLEARTSILPANAARFNVTLEAYQD